MPPAPRVSHAYAPSCQQAQRLRQPCWLLVQTPASPAAGGLQPLHVCAASSTQPAAAAAVVQALVAGGADPDALDAAGLTPLHHALRNPSARPALIQALVESGASARPLLERLGGRRR